MTSKTSIVITTLRTDTNGCTLRKVVLFYVRPDRQEFRYPTTISYEGQGSSEFQIGFSYQGLFFFESRVGFNRVTTTITTNTGTQDMTQFATMLAALDFRDAVASGNDDEVADIHTQSRSTRRSTSCARMEHGTFTAH